MTFEPRDSANQRWYRSRVVRLDRHEDLFGRAERLVLVVQAFEDLADELCGRQVLGLVEYESLAPDDPALPDEEHLHGRFEIVVGETDHVEVLVAIGHHLLTLDRLAHRCEAVANARRPLELECVRRFAHLGLEPLHDRVGLTVEELEELGDEPVVGRLVDLPDAGAAALLDVEEQARPSLPLVVRELVVAARTHGEGPQEQVERLADGVGVSVRAEVAHALAPCPPHDHGPRPLVVERHGEERVALVVPQPDVEPGPVTLDQRVLEHQRLDVVADLDPLDRLGGGDHLGRPRRQCRRALEVVREPLPQRLGLAHVDDPALGVLELVRTGRIGDRAGGRALQHGQVMLRALDAAQSGLHSVSSSHCRPGLRRHIRSRDDNPVLGDQAVRTVRQLERQSHNGGSTEMLRLQSPLPERYSSATTDQLDAWLTTARQSLGDRVFILGHHYQRDEVMKWADARGDSYRLAVLAQERPEAEFIVFCGVHFMAESADVLTADHQQVILPDLNAGCSMADMADLDEVEEAWESLGAVTDIERRRPDHLHELVGRPEGVRRSSRRRGLHLDQRTGRARVGALGDCGRTAGALLPRPAPRPQHRCGDGLHPRRHARVGPAPGPRAD